MSQDDPNKTTSQYNQPQLLSKTWQMSRPVQNMILYAITHELQITYSILHKACPFTPPRPDSTKDRASSRLAPTPPRTSLSLVLNYTEIVNVALPHFVPPPSLRILLFLDNPSLKSTCHLSMTPFL